MEIWKKKVQEDGILDKKNKKRWVMKRGGDEELIAWIVLEWTRMIMNDLPDDEDLNNEMIDHEWMTDQEVVEDVMTVGEKREVIFEMIVEEIIVDKIIVMIVVKTIAMIVVETTEMIVVETIVMIVVETTEMIVVAEEEVDDRIEMKKNRV